MLNFNVNLDVSIKSGIKYPIYFEKKNVCIHCGRENTLIFVDKFGRETKSEIYPFDHIKCKGCGRKYSIKWELDGSNDKMYPVPVELGIAQEFLNFIDRKNIKKNGEKEL